MNNRYAWAVIENIFWGSVALALFVYSGDLGSPWWRASALVPLFFINTRMPS